MIPSTGIPSKRPPTRKQAVQEAPTSRVVSRPVPQSQVKDARTYQIDQLKKRFSAHVSELDDGSTSLSFNFTPSDPDFPFDLDRLECEVHVPQTYPKVSPSLHIRNKNIPRGFGLNIERGWEKLVQEKKGASLLALTNALDRNLESFLSEQKAETVRLTIFKDTRHIDSVPEPAAAPVPPPQPRRAYVPEPSYSKDQIGEAKARRAQEVRQLEARMGRDPIYHRSSDGIVYTLPVEPKRRTELPVGLQTVRSFQLIVPLLYPLQAVRVLLSDADSVDAEPVEELFIKKAGEQKQMTLMSLINYLAQNMHGLAKQVQAEKTAAAAAASKAAEATPSAQAEETSAHLATATDAKSHVLHVPRPPEWGYGDDSGDSDDEDSFDSDESDEAGGAPLGIDPDSATASSAPTTQAERGTAISFPSLQLHGIELLQISILNISVKCERCKSSNELTNLRPSVTPPAMPCKKCAAPLLATFRPELLHSNSARAGFTDLAGCTVLDLLPSTFVPTCSRCSTASQPLISVRGDTTTNVCRECHGRFTFKLPEVRFLTYSATAALPSGAGVAPRRRTEKLGLHAGEPLPDRGACPHYRKSYRWFRFSCCNKVYPCDKCHDEQSGEGGKDAKHVNEWANRMICGFCSREQNYSPESCAFCGRSVIGKRGKGFWEGGKGTRNKTLMSRRDKRKYKRLGGGESKAS